MKSVLFSLREDIALIRLCYDVFTFRTVSFALEKLTSLRFMFVKYVKSVFIPLDDAKRLLGVLLLKNFIIKVYL